MEIRVSNVDQGIFTLMFLNPSNNKWVKSESLTSGCTADEMKAGIKGYYQKRFNIDPLVTLIY